MLDAIEDFWLWGRARPVLAAVMVPAIFTGILFGFLLAISLGDVQWALEWAVGTLGVAAMAGGIGTAGLAARYGWRRATGGSTFMTGPRLLIAVVGTAILSVWVGITVVAGSALFPDFMEGDSSYTEHRAEQLLDSPGGFVGVLGQDRPESR